MEGPAGGEVLKKGCDVKQIKSTRSSKTRKQREFYVVIEQDEDGFYVGEVPQLEGCYTQGRTLDELMKNIKEVIQLCLEDQDREDELKVHCVGIQKVALGLDYQRSKLAR
jgi:predicted RNase H-like HicB family nuclease